MRGAGVTGKTGLLGRGGGGGWVSGEVMCTATVLWKAFTARVVRRSEVSLGRAVHAAVSRRWRGSSEDRRWGTILGARDDQLVLLDHMTAM